MLILGLHKKLLEPRAAFRTKDSVEADLKYLCWMLEEQVSHHPLPMVLSAPLAHSVEHDKHGKHAQRSVMRTMDICMNESVCVCPGLDLSVCTGEARTCSPHRENECVFLPW